MRTPSRHSQAESIVLIEEAAGTLPDKVRLEIDQSCEDGGFNGCFQVRGVDRQTRCRLFVGRNLAMPPATLMDEGKDVPCVLVTPHVRPGKARVLQRNGVQFMDAAGNCHLDLPGLYLFVIGQPCPPEHDRPPPSRLFQASGLQVIFIYLASLPRLRKSQSAASLDANLEIVAERAGVSLGTASNTRRALLAEGYLVETPDGYEPGELAPLIRQWLDAYGRRLAPKLSLGRYRAPRADWWQRLKSDPAAFCWGGEIAAARLTDMLQPASSTLYLWSAPKAIIMAGQLEPDPDGDVELRRAFWENGVFEMQGCAHPWLVYADLVASDEPRNLEAAEEVYARYLAAALPSV